MTLEEAYLKSKQINKEQPNISAKIVKSQYGGYQLSYEPIELSVIKSSINTLISRDKSFMENYRLKYAR